jgi:hypothetical protein
MLACQAKSSQTTANPYFPLDPPPGIEAPSSKHFSTKRGYLLGSLRNYMLMINRGSHPTKINIPTKKTKILSARPNKPKQMILLFRKSQGKINNLINPHERSRRRKEWRRHGSIRCTLLGYLTLINTWPWFQSSRNKTEKNMKLSKIQINILQKKYNTYRTLLLAECLLHEPKINIPQTWIEIFPKKPKVDDG